MGERPGCFARPGRAGAERTRAVCDGGGVQQGGSDETMTKHAAVWRSGVLAGLSLALVTWAAAHGVKNWPVPEEAKKQKNPVPAAPSTLAAAKAIFLENCAQCHGEDGKGDGPEAPMYSVKPADFTDAHMMREMTDGEIFYKITEGRMPMPSFKKRLTDEQRWQLVNYVKTFAPKPAAKSSGAGGKKSAPHKHWLHNLSVFWKTASAICAGLVSLYGAWRGLKAVWNWCLEKYDKKVASFFEEEYRQLRLKGAVIMQPIPLRDLARAVNRKERCVEKSLRRLEHRGLLSESKDGWALRQQETRYIARF